MTPEEAFRLALQDAETESTENLEAAAQIYDDLNFDDTAVVACPMCEGYATLLGRLGTRRHYRCRMCGIDFSVDHR